MTDFYRQIHQKQRSAKIIMQKRRMSCIKIQTGRRGCRGEHAGRPMTLLKIPKTMGKYGIFGQRPAKHVRPGAKPPCSGSSAPEQGGWNGHGPVRRWAGAGAGGGAAGGGGGGGGGRGPETPFARGPSCGPRGRPPGAGCLSVSSYFCSSIQTSRLFSDSGSKRWMRLGEKVKRSLVP